MIGLSANIEEIKFPVEDVATQKTHTVQHKPAINLDHRKK